VSIYLQSLLAGVFAAFLSTNGAACALLEFTDKIEKQGLEQARLENLKKQKQPRSHSDSASPLQANPSAIAFGSVVVGSESRQTVVISNPAEFSITVVRVVVQGSEFAIISPLKDRLVIPAHDELTFVLAFHPAVQGPCSGELLLEIDSAVGRFTRVKLEGRGG